MARSPQTLSVEDRRLLAAWAADCVEGVLAIYESQAPGDSRVRAAIDQTRAFASGDLDVQAAIDSRGGEAGAAAREAPSPAAKAAAYAAEQAAAVAHMGAHALGAAGYAGKARVLAKARDQGDLDVIAGEVRRQVALLSPAAADVVALLPALGEDRAGPLGPGRLAKGHVGATIHAVQAQLRDRDPRRADVG